LGTYCRKPAYRGVEHYGQYQDALQQRTKKEEADLTQNTETISRAIINHGMPSFRFNTGGINALSAMANAPGKTSAYGLAAVPPRNKSQQPLAAWAVIGNRHGRNRR
jgi:hypothetical protein